MQLEWIERLWRRIDRDGNGAVSRAELDCDEFQEVIRAILAPTTKPFTTSVFYGRAEVNTKQAVDFCMYRADANADGKLSFEEFAGLVHDLNRSQADIIFAMFDLDSGMEIEQDEFKEIYRYLLGHEPTAIQFQEAWSSLDKTGSGRVNKNQYLAWLKTTDNAAFKQRQDNRLRHTATGFGHAAQGDGRGISKGSRSSATSSLPDLLLSKRKMRMSSEWRPPWNERFSSDVSKENSEKPQLRRTYFSNPQSLPELARYYQHRQPHFEVQKRRLLDGQFKEKAKKSFVTPDCMPLLPERHKKDGKMRNTHGEKVQWIDDWQTPNGMMRKEPPGSLMLRCPKSSTAAGRKSMHKP